jgi:hypothetical protein
MFPKKGKRIPSGGEWWRGIELHVCGRSGPTGSHLVGIIRNSDQALYALLQLAGRRKIIAATKVMAAHDTLAKAVQEIEALME